MHVAELMVALAMLVIALRALWKIYTDDGRAEFAASSPRYIFGVLLLLTGSATIRLWNHPDAMSHWFALGFNAISVVAAFVADRWRRREPSTSAS